MEFASLPTVIVFRNHYTAAVRLTRLDSNAPRQVCCLIWARQPCFEIVSVYWYVTSLDEQSVVNPAASCECAMFRWSCVRFLPEFRIFRPGRGVVARLLCLQQTSFFNLMSSVHGRTEQER